MGIEVDIKFDMIFEKYGRSYISNSLVEIYPEKESLCQTHYGELNYQFKSLSTILHKKVKFEAIYDSY